MYHLIRGYTYSPPLLVTRSAHHPACSVAETAGMAAANNSAVAAGYCTGADDVAAVHTVAAGPWLGLPSFGWDLC